MRRKKTLVWLNIMVTRAAASLLEIGDNLEAASHNFEKSDLFWIVLGFSKVFLFLVEKLLETGTKIKKLADKLR